MEQRMSHLSLASFQRDLGLWPDAYPKWCFGISHLKILHTTRLQISQYADQRNHFTQIDDQICFAVDDCDCFFKTLNWPALCNGHLIFFLALPHVTSVYDLGPNSWALHNFALRKIGIFPLSNYLNRRFPNSFICCHVLTFQPTARILSWILTRISPGERIPTTDMSWKEEDTRHLKCTLNFRERWKEKHPKSWNLKFEVNRAHPLTKEMWHLIFNSRLLSDAKICATL
jgi:hypothetical protein